METDGSRDRRHRRFAAAKNADLEHNRNFTTLAPPGVRNDDLEHNRNFTTLAPPGQLTGTTSKPDSGPNVGAIVAGVLVPVLVIGASLIAFYVWYRRKYPVRMVIGKDFGRFANPQFDKRASTLTLVREDAGKFWEEELDGVRNPGMEAEHQPKKVFSLVREDETDAIPRGVNLYARSQNDDTGSCKSLDSFERNEESFMSSEKDGEQLEQDVSAPEYENVTFSKISKDVLIGIKDDIVKTSDEIPKGDNYNEEINKSLSDLDSVQPEIQEEKIKQTMDEALVEDEISLETKTSDLVCSTYETSAREQQRLSSEEEEEAKPESEEVLYENTTVETRESDTERPINTTNPFLTDTSDKEENINSANPFLSDSYIYVAEDDDITKENDANQALTTFPNAETEEITERVESTFDDTGGEPIQVETSGEKLQPDLVETESPDNIPVTDTEERILENVTSDLDTTESQPAPSQIEDSEAVSSGNILERSYHEEDGIKDAGNPFGTYSDTLGEDHHIGDVVVKGAPEISSDFAEPEDVVKPRENSQSSSNSSSSSSGASGFDIIQKEADTPQENPEDSVEDIALATVSVNPFDSTAASEHSWTLIGNNTNPINSNLSKENKQQSTFVDLTTSTSVKDGHVEEQVVGLVFDGAHSPKEHDNIKAEENTNSVLNLQSNVIEEKFSPFGVLPIPSNDAQENAEEQDDQNKDRKEDISIAPTELNNASNNTFESTENSISIIKDNESLFSPNETGQVDMDVIQNHALQGTFAQYTDRSSDDESPIETDLPKSPRETSTSPSSQLDLFELSGNTDVGKSSEDEMPVEPDLPKSSQVASEPSATSSSSQLDLFQLLLQPTESPTPSSATNDDFGDKEMLPSIDLASLDETPSFIVLPSNEPEDSGLSLNKTNTGMVETASESTSAKTKKIIPMNPFDFTDISQDSGSSSPSSSPEIVGTSSFDLMTRSSEMTTSIGSSERSWEVIDSPRIDDDQHSSGLQNKDGESSRKTSTSSSSTPDENVHGSKEENAEEESEA